MSSIAKDLQGIISYRPRDQGGTSSLRCSNLHKSEYNLNHLSFSKSLKQRRARCSASPRTGETRRQEDQSGCQDASLKQRLCMPYLSCAWYTPWFGKSCKIELGRFTYVRKRHHLVSSYTQLPSRCWPSVGDTCPIFGRAWWSPWTAGLDSQNRGGGGNLKLRLVPTARKPWFVAWFVSPTFSQGFP